MGASCASTTCVLEAANELPSPTWNRMSINSVDLVVPAVPCDADCAGQEGAKGQKGTCCATAGSDAAVSGVAAAPREGAVGGMGAGAGAWLRSAACAAGAARTVEVAAGERRAEPVVVDLGALAAERGGADGAAASPAVAALDLVVGAGASATLVLIAPADPALPASSAPCPATCGWHVHIAAGEDSRVEVFSVVAACAMQCLDDLAIETAAGAQVTVRQFYLDAALTAAGLSCSLDGDRSSISVDTRYLGMGTAQLDFNYAVYQRGRSTSADLGFAGVLADAASKTLRDTIDLQRGCKGSTGKERESVVLVGDAVRNKSLPVILCDEDDVAGDHGATVGEVDPAQLSYLAARGLDASDVHALLMESTYQSALACAPVEEARAAVRQAAVRALGASWEEECGE